MSYHIFFFSISLIKSSCWKKQLKCLMITLLVIYPMQCQVTLLKKKINKILLPYKASKIIWQQTSSLSYPHVFSLHSFSKLRKDVHPISGQNSVLRFWPVPASTGSGANDKTKPTKDSNLFDHNLWPKFLAQNSRPSEKTILPALPIKNWFYGYFFWLS